MVVPATGTTSCGRLVLLDLAVSDGAGSSRFSSFVPEPSAKTTSKEAAAYSG